MFKEDYKDYKMVNTTEHMNLTAEYAKEMGLEPYYLYRQKSMATTQSGKCRLRKSGESRDL